MPTRTAASRPTLSWTTSQREGTCAVCGDSGLKRGVLEVAAPTGALRGSWCGPCGSLLLDGDFVDGDAPDDGPVDRYVEQYGGIATIVARLTPFADEPVRRFADVGCNFGFGVDAARRRFGWEAVGFDPGTAARRGAVELAADVRHELLRADTDVEPFDLILASEVIEHVEDPAAFLADIVAHLAPGGRLVLTTPSASTISPSVDLATTLSALSPGAHRFVLSRAALDALLEQAGLANRDVVDDGRTLVAHAAVDGPRLRVAAPGDDDGLPDYLEALAGDPDVSPLVRAGAAARHYAQAVLRGDLLRARRVRPALIEAMTERYGWSLDGPVDVAARSAAGERLPAFLTTVTFADGILAMHDDDVHRADRSFSDAVAAYEHFVRLGGLGAVDLEMADLAIASAAHRLVTTARLRPHETPAMLAHVDRLARDATVAQRHEIDRLVAGAFTGLVNAGAADESGVLLVRVEPTLDRLLAAGQTSRVAGLDALFCAGIHALREGRVDGAMQWFARCRDETAAEPPGSHGARLHVECVEQVGESGTRAAAARGGIDLALDVYWADAAGIYVAGQAQVPGDPASSITIRWGDTEATAPPLESGGFAHRLLGPLHPSIDVEVRGSSGTRWTTLVLPRHSLPDRPAESSLDEVTAALVDILVRELPAAGDVIALGVRGHTDAALLAWRDKLPGRRVIGVDIHEGPGVDVVGDAHRLVDLFEPGSIAAFVSDAVFEHLEAPWLAAAQVQRVLRVGGLALVSVPTAWPEHSAPNDFWRMSPFGVRSMFGAALGFEVLSATGTGTVSMVPSPQMIDRHATMPVIYGPATAHVLARKVRHLPDDAVRWPYDETAGRRRAEQYPVESVETGRHEVTR